MHIVCSEVGEFNSDILGYDGKILYEIELKKSFSDFKADFKKPKHSIYSRSVCESNLPTYQLRKLKAKYDHIPHYFIFFVTDDISEKCLEYLNNHSEYSKYGLATVKNVGAIVADNIRFLKKPKKLHNSVIKEEVVKVILKRMSSELANFHILQRYDIEAANRLNLMIEKYNK